jgi:hypothetical protein
MANIAVVEAPTVRILAVIAGLRRWPDGRGAIAVGVGAGWSATGSPAATLA